MTLEVARSRSRRADARRRLAVDGPLTDEELQSLDPSGLWRRLVALPEQMAEAWALGSTWNGLDATVSRVLVVGMGGSAIGAQLAARIVQQRSPIPVEVWRDSFLPVTDAGTLLVFCSFSGETEEVLSAVRSSEGHAGPKVVITRGGALGREAASAGIPMLCYRYEGEPRSALGYGMMLILGMLHRLGLFPVTGDEVQRTLCALRETGATHHPDIPAAENPARSIAGRIGTAIPLIFADASLGPAAVRWQNQCNENSKRWAFCATLPEALHNIVEGITPQAGQRSRFHTVLLQDMSRNGIHRARMLELQRSLSEAGVPSTRLSFTGDTDLSILLQACLVGDWVSYYLALDAKVDPAPVPAISEMKARLAAGHP
jgi:glucose/mannose-6-phosphate isomerase